MSKFQTAMEMFRNLRKAEEGSIEAALTVTMMALPAVVIGSMAYFSLAPYAADLPAQEIGSHMETWIVTQPNAEITVSETYVPYTQMASIANFPKEVAQELPAVKSGTFVWSKVIPQEKSSEFVICMYRGDTPVPSRNDEVFSYDSVTGEEVMNESEVCL